MSPKAKSSPKMPTALTLQVEFADFERSHLKPGLFQIMQGGRKSNERLDLYYPLPDNGFIRITGPFPLRPYDARLLCAILCKAGQRKIVLPADVQDPAGLELRSGLELLDDAKSADCLAIKTNMAQLVKAMGLTWHGAKSCKEIEDSLDRMFDISIRIQKGKKKYRSHLLSSISIDENDSTMAIAIDPILADALMGGGHFARIDMDQLRKLRNNESLLFIMLSNLINPGSRRRFTPEELRLLLYGPVSGKMMASTFSQQKSRAVAVARKLVESLDGWQMEEKGGFVCIYRPLHPCLTSDSGCIMDAERLL